MKKSLLALAGIVSAIALFAVPAFAATAGQVEGGDIYRVRNVSNNGEFTDPTSGTCGNTFQFKVRIHNPGPDPLTSVSVKATLPTTAATSHSSQVTVTATNANPKTTTDTAGVRLDKAAQLTYIKGSTELLDANGSKLSTLGDTILTSGVTIDTVGVSTQQKRFVQFSVKSDCPEPPKPPVKEITVCDLASKKIITIKESEFDDKKHSTRLDDCKEVVKKIKVCELSTKKIIEINEKDFNDKRHSKRLADCAEKPAPGEITVCDVTTGEVITIKEDAFDESKHSKDTEVAACTEETPVETPAELPKTGANGALVALGLSALTTGIAYAVTGRKTLLG